MYQVTTIINHPAGLHARPATLFVQRAKQYGATITVRNGERHANAKSIVQVMMLGAKQGTTLELEAEGDDAEQALDALKALVESDFEGSA